MRTWDKLFSHILFIVRAGRTRPVFSDQIGIIKLIFDNSSFFKDQQRKSPLSFSELHNLKTATVNTSAQAFFSGY